MSGEGELAGYARLGLRPGEGRAWWWTALVGRGRVLVLVRDHDVDPPKAGTFEIRAPGLWSEPVCETPMEHWSLGLEALAVALDDPTEAYGRERGEPVPLGLDLEWEAAGPAEPTGADAEDGAIAVGGYRQACVVHGDVLVGQARLAVDGHGIREHAWGRRDWWTSSSAWLAGLLDDGTAVSSQPTSGLAIDLDGRGLISGGRLGRDRQGQSQGETVLLPVLHAPLQVPSDDGRISRLARALCRVEAADRRRGWAGPSGFSRPEARPAPATPGLRRPPSAAPPAS